MDIVGVVRIFMKAKGMTVKDVAVEAGIARQSVYNLLEEKRAPSFETLERIACAFDISLSELIALAEERGQALADSKGAA